MLLFGISVVVSLVVADAAVSEVISAVGCSVAPSAARKHILILKHKSSFKNFTRLLMGNVAFYQYLQ